MTNQAQDIDAIHQYIQDKGTRIPDFPKLGPIVTGWRGWYADLSWYRKNIDQDAMTEAVEWRAKVNAAMGLKPVPWTPADKRDRPKPSPTAQQAAELALQGAKTTLLIAAGLGAVVLGYTLNAKLGRR